MSPHARPARADTPRLSSGEHALMFAAIVVLVPSLALALASGAAWACDELVGSVDAVSASSAPD